MLTQHVDFLSLSYSFQSVDLVRAAPPLYHLLLTIIILVGLVYSYLWGSGKGVGCRDEEGSRDEVEGGRRR